MDRKILSFGIVVAGILVLGHGARASVLGPPSTLAQCTDFIVVQDPASCALSGHAASAAASLTLGPFVSLTAQVTSGPIGADPLVNPGAGTFVVVNYPFLITGGHVGDTVPILVATNLTTNASSFDHALGFASLFVHTSFGDRQIAVCTDNTCGTTSTSFSGTLATSADSGEPADFLELEIEASSGDSPNSEWANASADPHIFIDPSFAGASQYSVELPAGVSNHLAPEPSSLGLLLGGVSLVALRRRPRSRAAQPPA